MEITPAQLERVFDLAEQKTAEQFGAEMCAMMNRNGNHECPICYFRARVKIELGLNDGSVIPKEQPTMKPSETKLIAARGIPFHMQVLGNITDEETPPGVEDFS